MSVPEISSGGGCVDLELVQRVCMAHLDAQQAESEGIVVELTANRGCNTRSSHCPAVTYVLPLLLCGNMYYACKYKDVGEMHLLTVTDCITTPHLTSPMMFMPIIVK